MGDTAVVGAELRRQIETMLATHDREEWKNAGLEATACMIRMWMEEQIPDIKQENRRLKQENEQLRRELEGRKSFISRLSRLAARNESRAARRLNVGRELRQQAAEEYLRRLEAETFKVHGELGGFPATQREA